MAKLGKEIIVKKNGTAIAGVRTNEIQNSCDAIEACSPSSGVFKEYVAGRRDWQLSVGYLVVDDSDMLALLDVGNTYTLQFLDRENNGQGVQGSALLTVCTITAQESNIVKGSFVFKGTGALTPVQEVVTS